MLVTSGTVRTRDLINIEKRVFTKKNALNSSKISPRNAWGGITDRTGAVYFDVHPQLASSRIWGQAE